MPTAETAPHPITDLDLAASYGRMCGTFAKRAHDVRLNHSIVTGWKFRTGQPFPKAEAFEDDFLAEFDKLAVVAERIRATRANADAARAA